MRKEQKDILRLVGAVLLLVATYVGAQAETLACAQAILGAWAGPVLEAGMVGRQASTFMEKNGDLVGEYHVNAEDVEYDGILESFHATGSCEGDFVWNDAFGTGTIHIIFSPDRERFDGLWGRSAPLQGQIFNGRRVMPKPVS